MDKLLRNSTEITARNGKGGGGVGGIKVITKEAIRSFLTDSDDDDGIALPSLSSNMLPLVFYGIVLQCVVVCCSVLQCVEVCCSVFQCVAVCCTVSPSVDASVSAENYFLCVGI